MDRLAVAGSGTTKDPTQASAARRKAATGPRVGYVDPMLTRAANTRATNARAANPRATALVARGQ